MKKQAEEVILSFYPLLVVALDMSYVHILEVSFTKGVKTTVLEQPLLR